jgi:hypothetical protein
MNPDLIELAKLARLALLARIAEAKTSNVSPESIAYLEAFEDGVSRFIAGERGRIVEDLFGRFQYSWGNEGKQANKAVADFLFAAKRVGAERE